MKKGPSPAKKNAVMKGLKQALRNEIDGAEFYRMAAGSARRDAVRQMYQFLMEEEERHRAAIVDQMQRTAEGKGMKFGRAASSKKALGKFKSPLLTDDLVKEGRQVEGEVAALSIGMTLEKRAIAQFIALRKTVAGDARAEKVLSDLIAWEQDHLDVLMRHYDQLREMFWEEARFWPF
ncbi:MAG TPA: ferritin family protein [Desulfobacteria bacterium]|nr:ferritin family protein [Desulfobacteria bacterium]